MYDPPVLFSDQVAVLTSTDGSVQIVFTAETVENPPGPKPIPTRMVLARVKLPREVAAQLAAKLPQATPNTPTPRAN